MPTVTIEFTDDGESLQPRRCTFLVSPLDPVTGHALPDELIAAIVEAASPLSVTVGSTCYWVRLEESRGMLRASAERVKPEEALALVEATQKIVEDLCQQAKLAAAVCRAYLKG